MDPFPEGTKAREILERIRSALPEPVLVPVSTPLRELPRELEGLGDEELLGRRVADPLAALAVRSGLLLRADHLDVSHRLSQQIPTATGSYWHGIMHRREPDYGNAKYWFRRVGEHPVLAELDREAPRLVPGEVSAECARAGRWNPFHFVDLCEACGGGTLEAIRSELMAIQELEIALLLRHSWKTAAAA